MSESSSNSGAGDGLKLFVVLIATFTFISFSYPFGLNAQESRCVTCHTGDDMHGSGRDHFDRYEVADRAHHPCRF